MVWLAPMSCARIHLAFLGMAFGAAVATASHLPDLTSEEETCERTVAKALAKFQSSKIKCLVKCDKGAAAGEHPDSDCLPPYGGAALACVQAAEAKAARSAATKKCVADCPECFTGGCPAYVGGLVSLAEILVDAGVPDITCDESQSGDGLTPDERKCRQAVASQAAKIGTATAKCLTKCRKAEEEGTLPPGACVPATVTDPETVECLEKALTKCVLKSDKKCPDPPECLGDTFFVCFGASGVVQTFHPLVFCGS
jgi:hypothetical protein